MTILATRSDNIVTCTIVDDEGAAVDPDAIELWWKLSPTGREYLVPQGSMTHEGTGIYSYAINPPDDGQFDGKATNVYYEFRITNPDTVTRGKFAVSTSVFGGSGSSQDFFNGPYIDLSGFMSLANKANDEEAEEGEVDTKWLSPEGGRFAILGDRSERLSMTLWDTGSRPSMDSSEVLTRMRAGIDELVQEGGGKIEIDPFTWQLPAHTTSLTPDQQKDILLNLPSNIEIVNRGRIEGAIMVVGDALAKTEDPVRQLVSPVTAGQQSFSGDFGHLSPGDKVALELVGNGDSSNQFGLDILTVDTASGSALNTIETARWAYNVAKISKISKAVQHSGVLARAAFTISGNYTAYFAAGDWIRIENIDGTDCYVGSGMSAGLVNGDDKAYFEYVKIKTIDGSGITLDQRLAYAYENPWFILSAPRENVKVSGGYIGQLVAETNRDVRYKDIDCGRLRPRFLFDFAVDGIKCDAAGSAIGVGFGHCRGGIVSNIQSRGAVSATGNANIKFLSMLDTSITGLRSDDVTSSSSGCFGVQTDSYFTPYNPWHQNCVHSDIRADGPKGTSLLSAWFGVTRDCHFENIHGSQEVRFQHSRGAKASGISSAVRIEWQQMEAGSKLSNFKCPTLGIISSPKTEIRNGTFTETNGVNSNRQIFGRTSMDDMVLDNLRSISADASDTFMYFRNGLRVKVTNVFDLAGLAASLNIDSTMKLFLGGNDLKGSVSTPTIQVAAGVLDLTDWKLPVYNIDTEGSTGVSDDIDTFSGMRVGEVYVLKIQNSARDIVLKHGTGNFVSSTGSDITIGTTTQRVLVVYDGTSVKNLTTP